MLNRFHLIIQNYKRKNFKAKHEAEWEFRKKYLETSIKKIVFNSKIFQNNRKPSY